MDWQASIEERGALITFRGLTRQISPSAPLGDIEKWIEPGQEWGGRSFEEWLAFLKQHGQSATIRFDESGAVVERST
jgi:hypothetical protein